MNGDTQKHHIIPKHANGSDESWNLISLSIEDHKEAHCLLYETYQLMGDLCAINFWSETITNGYQLRIKLSHNSQKQNQSGFFNSEQQRKNGKKGGAKKSQNKTNTYRQKVCQEWQEILDVNHTWVYTKTNFKLEIKAFECFLPQDITNKMLTYEIFSDSYKAKPQSLTSALSRVIRNKRLHACGWRLEK